jgi:thiol-disulfide isomerase/thioredoxin
MQNGIKNLVLDTNFDNSFINEQVYQFDFNENKEDAESAFVYADLQLPVDSFQYAITKTIPVKILMNDIDSVDKIGDNDSLQVYISPNFFYQGYFMNNVDTVFVNLKTQNFDLFYNKLMIAGTYFHKEGMNNPKHFDFYSKKPIQIRNRKYQFEDCDVINKTLILSRLEDDSIGTNRGNYLAQMPELDSLYGYTLLFFTGSWCKPCKILLDSLLLFNKWHPETHIISVNNERDSAQFITYLNKYQIPWKIILEMEPKIENPFLALKEFYNKDSKTDPISYSDFYDVNAFPTLFLINSQRKILYVAEDHIQGIALLKKIDKEGYENLEILLK